MVGRMIAVQLSTRLDKPVIVENQGGAGGLIGTEMAARSQPDGYTLLLVSVAYAFIPAIYKLPYDPATAFAPVAMLGAGPVVIAVTSKLPVSSVKELIALAKEKPGELNYATAGSAASSTWRASSSSCKPAWTSSTFPFKGGGPAMMDVIAGNTQIAIGSLVQMLPQIKAGKLKALGVGSAKRIAALPDLPTISEAGVPGYEVTNWWGIVVPAGTPRSIIDRLHKDLTAVVASAETQEALRDRGRRTAVDEPGRIRPLHRGRNRKVGARGEGRRDPRRVGALRQRVDCLLGRQRQRLTCPARI